MNNFPRTTVGEVSVSRMIIGTNWFLGFSHCTAARDKLIMQYMDRRNIADVIVEFMKAGVDTIMGLMQRPLLYQAIQEAQDRTGKKLILISTPTFSITPQTAERGVDHDEAAKILDAEAKLGTTFCLPHESTTDCLVDKCTRQIRHMDKLCKMIRERGMIPGLSTHTPETIVFADSSGLDVETYISIYNSMGFLMHLEVDWIHRIIHKARKPVITIKPMASGQLRPFQALTFVWSTIREQDMVTIGCMTPDEVKECIELSLTALGYAEGDKIELQETRSKAIFKEYAKK